MGRTLGRVPLPASKTRLKRVGQALAAGTATADDERLYREFLRTCDDALAKVTARLAQTGLTAVVRVKTRDTMVDKLRRQPSIALSTMDDVAGCRLVLDGDRDAQDRTVEQVRELFNRDGASAEVKDRRAFPSYGYRAVHVLVRLDDVRIEVQVRTQLQHLWAELSEKFADRVGRHVRYGGAPSGETEREAFELLQTVATNIDEMERGDCQLKQMLAELAMTRDQLRDQLTVVRDLIPTSEPLNEEAQLTSEKAAAVIERARSDISRRRAELVQALSRLLLTMDPPVA